MHWNQQLLTVLDELVMSIYRLPVDTGIGMERDELKNLVL